MVLELARLRTLDRPVPAVVHSGRDLVREQSTVEVEQLDAADADVVERVEQRHDARFRRGLQRAVVPAAPARG